MPTTVSELIHSSFRLIGAIVAGETLETNELNDAFISLNQMLMSWNTEGASLVAREKMNLTITASGFAVLPKRPVKIESASVFSGHISSPVELVDAAGWSAIPEPQATSVYTKKLYCDYGFPTSTVYYWPLPRFAGASLEMWIYTVMAQFTALEQEIDLPFGYEIAIRYNFAIVLLPEYPRSQVDPTLPAQAQMYKASIVQLNASNHMRSQAQSPVQAAAAQVAEVAQAR